MSISSNLYAGKIFSEHPIALYPLDDDISYISLISDSQRLFNSGGWSASANNSASVVFDDSPTVPSPGSPFDSDIYTSASVSGISLDNTEIIIESPSLFNFSDLNQAMKTFASAIYLYQDYLYVNWYEFGYKYDDIYTSSEKEVVTRVIANESIEWINFDTSFVPPEFESENIKIFLRINVDAPSGGGSGEANFLVNGITIGQWSENSSSESLGVQEVETPLGYSGTPALEYGIQENSAYHIIEDSRLLAVNQGIPMVYGSDNLTKIYPSASANPSLIIPGNGFLFEKGRYKKHTVEFWMRINPDTIESRRIFGPINNDYGIYVRDGMISLLIGDNFGSHAVAQWYRPMLVHVVIDETNAYLFINGEQVIDISINKETLDLPSENDWVAFYSYSDILEFEVDCVSFYNYPIALQVAKRRLVYGQGTDSPQNIADNYKGTNAYINFSNAEYTANKVYPDIANWEAGYRNNLVATRRSISSPNYSLPEVFIGGRSVQDLYNDNKIVNDLTGDSFFTFRPNTLDGKFTTSGLKWNEPGYLYFDSLGIFDSLSSFYGVYSTLDPDQTSTLVLINNSNTSDEFEITLDQGTIYYKFNNEVISSQTINEITYSDYYEYNNYNFEWSYNAPYGYGYGDILGWEYSFAFGINIKNFVENGDYRLKRFFRSPESLQAYFGGNGTNTFIGKIHSIGFSNIENYSEISSVFLQDGSVDYTEYEFLANHYATYTLVPMIRFNRFFLDISISSKWEEYFPLASFAGYVKDSLGNTYYDIDSLQINFGFPSITERVFETIENTGWTYLELHNEYNHPVFKSYEILDNSLITGYQDYDDLQNNNIVQSFINTEKSSIRAYTTFQLLSEGSNEPLSNFPYSSRIIDCCFVDAASVNTNDNPYKAYKTKFEIVDGVVVFPPKNIDFKDVSINLYFDIKQDGIISSPVKIRDLEISSRALSQYEVNKIGTESGLPIYPYTKSGIYFDRKEQNPIRISKKRMPYLALSKDSGIKALGRQDVEKEYGVAVPINQERKTGKDLQNPYSIGAMQVWAKFDNYEFPATNYPVFEIQDINKTIEFVISATSSTERGIIVARNKQTKLIENNIIFYQNGKRVKNPIIEKNEWNAIGISFEEPLNFNGYTGYINLFRGMTFNNISYYPTFGLGEVSSILARTWLRVLTADDISNFDWKYWYDQNGLSEIQQWRDVYVVDETRTSALTPKDIYKTFIGTNRIVVDDDDSISIDADQLSILSDVSWNRFSGTPA